MAGAVDIFSRAFQKVGGNKIVYVTITAVTKANPGVVTYSGQDPQSGDLVYISDVSGMTELNGNTYQCGSVNTSSNTFNLLDQYAGSNVNTSSYTTYTSGGTAFNITAQRELADAVLSVYENARDSELRSHNWNFAIKRKTLSAPTLTITGITAAEPPVVTYTGTQPDAEDRVYIESVVGMTEVNGNYYRIASVTSTTFTLTDTDDGTNIDGTGFTTYTSGGTATVCPVWGWNRKFALPSDYLRLIEIYGMTGTSQALGDIGSAQDFNLEDGYIVCNDSGPIFIRYVYKNTTVNDWDIMFREAVACRIALEISHQIKQNDANLQILTQQYAQVISQAKLADSIETPGEILPVSDWLMARY